MLHLGTGAVPSTTCIASELEVICAVRCLVPYQSYGTLVGGFEHVRSCLVTSLWGRRHAVGHGGDEERSGRVMHSCGRAGRMGAYGYPCCPSSKYGVRH